ncbi:MAG: hypothetical protein ACREBO_10600 [Novosphingobium sp.]
MRRGLTALAAGALICAPASAATREWVQTEEAVAARLIAVGTWDFSAARRGPDGKPECHESWTFNADGTGRIVSGKQRVTNRWWVKRDVGIGQFLFITDLATTEGPDCMGRAVEKSEYPDGRGHPGFQLLFYGDGEGALVCLEGKTAFRPDGSWFPALEPDDCWGRIVPASRDRVGSQVSPPMKITPKAASEPSGEAGE